MGTKVPKGECPWGGFVRHGVHGLHLQLEQGGIWKERTRQAKEFREFIGPEAKKTVFGHSSWIEATG